MNGICSKYGVSNNRKMSTLIFQFIWADHMHVTSDSHMITSWKNKTKKPWCDSQ